MAFNPHRIQQLFYYLVFICLSLLTAFPACAQDTCPPSDNKKANRLYEQAQSEFKKRLLADAYNTCKKVLEEENDYAAAYLMMGLINVQRSIPNYSAAEKNFLKAIEICPGINPYAYFYLGDIAYSNQQYPEAVRYLQLFMKDADRIKTDKDYDRAEKILRYASSYLELTKNPVPFSPVPVKDISTPMDEYLAIISPDNEMALFTRLMKMPASRDQLIPKDKFVERFMFAERQKNGFFDEGYEMPKPFNQSDNEGGASLSVDNRFLVYTRCKYTTGNYYNCDICYSELIRGDWTEIQPLGKNVNLPDAWESQPSVSADGKTVYFISDRKGGLGGLDIYKTTRLDNGDWSMPVNLGAPINTPGNEKSPFIHPDNRTLYFSSDGHTGMGGYDIFFSRLGEDGKWGKPKNIGYPINSTSDDVGFTVSTDGHYGYFASNKLKGIGGWDIFSFDLYPEARPEQVLLVKGEVKNETTRDPVKAKIELKNVSTRKVTEIPVDSITGEYAAVVLFKNDYIMTVKKEGFGFESKYIAKEDTAFIQPVKVNIEIKPIEVGQTYKLNDINYASDSFELKPESKIVIDGFFEFLSENPGIKVSIQGYTDDIGKDDYNQKLSENRAKSVYEYLIRKGISQNRLSYKGFGEANPVAPNTTEEGRAKNRRTVFVITGK
ncbi:MAG: OmpA family protein [Bacteroidetes bacterium]|nr:OmpA family protein [Bacteroidota bacterium]